MFLEILQNSQENTCARVSSLISSRHQPATLLKKRFWHRRFPVNFAKFLRTPFLTEHLQWLLLTLLKPISKKQLAQKEKRGNVGKKECGKSAFAVWKLFLITWKWRSVMHPEDTHASQTHHTHALHSSKKKINLKYKNLKYKK